MTNNFGQVWATRISATFSPYAAGHIPASLTWRGDGVTNIWDGNTNDLAWLEFRDARSVLGWRHGDI